MTGPLGADVEPYARLNGQRIVQRIIGMKKGPLVSRAFGFPGRNPAQRAQARPL